MVSRSTACTLFCILFLCAGRAGAAPSKEELQTYAEAEKKGLGLGSNEKSSPEEALKEWQKAFETFTKAWPADFMTICESKVHGAASMGYADAATEAAWKKETCVVKFEPYRAGLMRCAEAIRKAAPVRLTKFRALDVAKNAQRIATDTTNTSPACYGDIANLAQSSPPRTDATCMPPGKPEDSKSCDEATPGAGCWGGPYLKEVPTDGWGHPFRLSLVTLGKTELSQFSVLSAGPDGKFGTPDDIEVKGP